MTSPGAICPQCREVHCMCDVVEDIPTYYNCRCVVKPIPYDPDVVFAEDYRAKYGPTEPPEPPEGARVRWAKSGQVHVFRGGRWVNEDPTTSYDNVDLPCPPGTKHDQDKPRTDLLPAHAVEAVADVLTYGARKYAPDNWRTLDDLRERYTGAALRHILKHMQGEELDPESGLDHLAHAACSILFVLEDKLG